MQHTYGGDQQQPMSRKGFRSQTVFHAADGNAYSSCAATMEQRLLP